MTRTYDTYLSLVMPVVNCFYPYSIIAIHFKDTDWMEEMKTKVWFKPECEESLRKALHRAKEIISIIQNN